MEMKSSSTGMPVYALSRLQLICITDSLQEFQGLQRLFWGKAPVWHVDYSTLHKQGINSAAFLETQY